MAQAKHALLRRLMIAFHPLLAQKARTRISKSEPNRRRRVGSCILSSGVERDGGLTRSNLLVPEYAVLGRRSKSGELDSWTDELDFGSSANEDDKDDMRDNDSGSGSGECGGAKPVMQSITSTRCGLLAGEVLDDVLPVLLCIGGSFSRSSRVVDAGRLRRSARWMALYV